MKNAMRGDEKVKEICDLLRNDVLSPAKNEAEAILNQAHQEAKAIIQKAKKEASELLEQNQNEIRRQKEVFESSLKLSAKQSLQFLQGLIEKQLLDRSLLASIVEKTNSDEIVTKMIDAVVTAVQKEGLGTDLEVVVSQSVDPKQLLAALSNEVKKTIGENGIVIGEIQSGVQVRIIDQNMSIDFSGNVLKELLANFVREDFRKILFNAE